MAVLRMRYRRLKLNKKKTLSKTCNHILLAISIYSNLKEDSVKRHLVGYYDLNGVIFPLFAMRQNPRSVSLPRNNFMQGVVKKTITTSFSNTEYTVIRLFSCESRFLALK